MRVVVGASASEPQKLVLAFAHDASAVVVCAGSSLGVQGERLAGLSDSCDEASSIDTGKNERQLHCLSLG